jgi:hypothetical protein
MLWLILLAASASAAPVPVKLTTYATPRERDFGDKPSEKVRWKSPLDGRWHESLFVPGFADRDATDPVLPDVSGVAMEGAGLIDPSLHASDPALAPLLRRGWRYLTLDRWNEKKRKAFFTLAKTPLAADEKPLIAGFSAAVRAGNKLFPRGRRVRLTCGGRTFGERRIHDECSSCADDRHIDLYVAASTAPVSTPEDCSAELLTRTAGN